jgi:hypothetical protein
MHSGTWRRTKLSKAAAIVAVVAMYLMCTCQEEKSEGNWPRLSRQEVLLLLWPSRHPFLLGIPGEIAQTPSQAADVGIAFLECTRRSCTSGLWGQATVDPEGAAIEPSLSSYNLLSYPSVPPTAVQSRGQPPAAETRKSSMPWQVTTTDAIQTQGGDSEYDCGLSLDKWISST